MSGQIAGVALTAVVIGLVEAGLVAFYVSGRSGAYQFVPPRIWVVAPLVWLAIATAVGAIALPLLRRWGGLLTIAALGALAVFIRLKGPWLVLAGVAVGGLVLLALLARPLLRWMSRPRRALAACVIGGVVAANAVAIGLGGGSRGTPAPGTAGPNVIVVFLDTVRYDAVLDPEGRVLPGLPALARLRSESTAFTRAFSPSPWTLPAHLSAVTGLPPHQVGVSFDWQVYSRADETLAERFRRRGYRTAAVISNTFINAGTGFARGYDRFEQAQSGLDLCRTGPGSFADRIWPWFAGSICNWTASDVTRRALAQMDDADGPFFLTLNYMDAHDPYYVERSCGEPNGYAAAIRCLDRSLAPIVDWRSPRRPTVIAVTSDHGEQFGEHGLGHHGNSVYVQLLHVPLIVRGAEAGGARTDTQPISLSALPALVGGIDGLPQRGGPLLALLHPPASTGRRSEWSATDGAWHLIDRERGRESLYHLPSDPAEARDLAASPPADPAIARLRAAIQEMRREPKPDLRRFRSLGYVH